MSQSLLQLPGVRAEAPRRAIHVSGYVRRGRDFYATPEWVTEALLLHGDVQAPIWEPCCGDGAMAKVLRRMAIR